MNAKYLSWLFVAFLSKNLCAAERGKKQKEFTLIVRNDYENPIIVKYGSDNKIIHNGSSTLVGPLHSCIIETTGFTSSPNLEITDTRTIAIYQRSDEIKITQGSVLLATLTKILAQATSCDKKELLQSSLCDDNIYYRYCVYSPLH